MTELRRHARLKTEVDVKYGLDDSRKFFRAKTKTVDISLGGIGLVISSRCPKGMSVILKIFLRTDKARSIRLAGRVVWQEQYPCAGYRTGIAFNHLSDADREKLSNFMFQKMYTMVGVKTRAGLRKYAEKQGWKITGS
jgi:c-di-GMP-binding flagellar brake protein YcgR